MNDSNPFDNPPQDNGIPQNMGVGPLLRCAADDELTAQSRADLDAHLAAHPQDAARIRFECDLRSACCRVMSAHETPAALRQLVAARLAQDSEPAVITPKRVAAVAPEVVIAGRIGPNWAQRWGFVAAAVLLAGSGVALLVRGGMLTTQQQTAGVNGTSAAVVLSTFLSQEHQRCSSDQGLLAHKLTATDASRAPQMVQKVLGRPVSVESMTAAGFEFVGAGDCSVPGADKSVHLMFRRPTGTDRRGPLVSLFIEPDSGRLDLEEGVTYAVDEGESGRARVLAWAHEGLVYYLVTKCSVSCSAAREGLEAPESLAGLTP